MTGLFETKLERMTDPGFRRDALRIVQDKWMMRDPASKKPLEDVDGMINRVVNTVVAGAEEDLNPRETARNFHEMINRMVFMPNSPAFMGAGTPSGQLAACFVLDIKDDMGSIFTTLKEAALIQQTGGGTGFSFSNLRRTGAPVARSNGTASGPVSFLEIYNKAFEKIRQGGRRRGACMAVLKVNHPDIREFIRCKNKEGTLTTFNLSVGITDKFMRAVQEDRPFYLVDPHSLETIEEVSAKELFKEIAECARRNGEPGLLFLDRINAENPVPRLYTIEATNPCLSADTIITTTEGPKRIDELIGVSFTALVYGHPHISKGGFFKTGTKEIYQLRTNEGYTLRLTKDHRVLTWGKRLLDPSQFVPAGKLAIGDLLALNTEGPLSEPTAAKFSGLYSTGEEDVYDCTIDDDTHMFSANGIIVHNCAEQPLGPYENCCLGSINLSKFVIENDNGKVVDWQGLSAVVHDGVDFLDRVVSANKYHPDVPELKMAANRTRKIGLSVMGLADVLYVLRIPYNSQVGIDFVDSLFEWLRFHAMYASMQLAKKRGPFPAIDESIYCSNNFTMRPPAPKKDQFGEYVCLRFGRPTVNWEYLLDEVRAHGVRNATTLTVAPTGTVGTVAGVEGYGIEPAFALKYSRAVLLNDKKEILWRISPLFDAALQERGVTLSDDEQEVLESTGSCVPLKRLPADIRQVFVTARDIQPAFHVAIQATAQRWVDSGISKTVNMPSSVTADDVMHIYMEAYQQRCKGITVYVDHSREEEVLSTDRKTS